MSNSRFLGRHILIELAGCDADAVSQVDFVRDTMVAAARAARATIVDENFHTFEPQGVSGVVVIAESHLAIHTWPEHGHASIDIYTCGAGVDPWKAYEVLKKAFKAERSTTEEMPRGPRAAARKPLLTSAGRATRRAGSTA